MPADMLTYRIALSLLPGMNRQRVINALSLVGDDAQELFDMPECQLMQLIPGLGKAAKTQIRFQALEAARRETEFAARHNVKCTFCLDSDYPTRLEICDNAPAMLYTLGKCDLNAAHTISVVGTRQCTAYGAVFTENLIDELARRIESPVIISGLAYGIDICAHRAAISHDIPTVAVVAHGLSTIYPASHRDTASRMVRGRGMILSDYRHDAAVHRSNFLARNRMVAALSDAVVVIESGEHGGALATANLANKYGRKVFALPGRVTDSHSDGCNRLISRGIARILLSADDIITELGWSKKSETIMQTTVTTDDFTPEEIAALRYLSAHPDADTEELAAALKIPIGRMMSVMIGLELKETVSSINGGNYIISKTNSPEGLL